MKTRPFDSVLMLCLRRVLAGLTLLVLLMGLLPARGVHAAAPTPVVDQSFTDPGDSSAAINQCCRYYAQTFTAGMTGALTAVSLDVQSTSSLFLKVAIHGVTNGLPNDTILSEVFVWAGPGGVPASSAPLTLMIDVGTIYVVAGKQYAIVVNYDGTSPGQAEGNWMGAVGDHYPGGAAFAANDETFASWIPLGVPSMDLHFKTYVVPNVPVHDLSLTFTSGAAHAKACQTFEETFTIRNDGPDTATNVVLGLNVTDQFDVMSVQGIDGRQSPPLTLAPGQSVTLKAIIKVTAFVPTESRDGWFSAHVFTDVWPAIEIDPNAANDDYSGSVRLISRPRTSCPG